MLEIQVDLDVMMARRKVKLNDLAEAVQITPQNLSILKNNKAKAIRFSTLVALCEYLDCGPGDILKVVKTDSQTPEDTAKISPSDI